MRLSIPSSSLLKAPRIRQRKGGPLLSLSLSLSPPPQSLYVSRPLSPALCSSFERWRTNCSRNFELKIHFLKICIQGVKTEKLSCWETTHLWMVCCVRVPVRRGKSLWGHIQLCVVESLFVYTCDRWMGLLLAAPSSFRSPKSPALSKSNNYAHNNIGLKTDYLLSNSNKTQQTVEFHHLKFILHFNSLRPQNCLPTSSVNFIFALFIDLFSMHCIYCIES